MKLRYLGFIGAAVLIGLSPWIGAMVSWVLLVCLTPILIRAAKLPILNFFAYCFIAPFLIFVVQIGVADLYYFHGYSEGVEVARAQVAAGSAHKFARRQSFGKWCGGYIPLRYDHYIGRKRGIASVLPYKCGDEDHARKRLESLGARFDFRYNRLRVTIITNDSLTDSDLNWLVAVPDLGSVYVSSPRITSESFKYFQNLDLIELNLLNTQLADEDQEKLQELLPNCLVRVASGPKVDMFIKYKRRSLAAAEVQ